MATFALAVVVRADTSDEAHAIVSDTWVFPPDELLFVGDAAEVPEADEYESVVIPAACPAGDAQ